MRWRVLAGFGVWMALAVAPVWACSDPAQPLASPVEGVRLIFRPEPRYLTDVDVQPASFTRGKLEALPAPRLRSENTASLLARQDRFGLHGGTVLFFESDGRGGLRLCRYEVWESRLYKPSWSTPSLSLRTSNRDRSPDPFPYTPAPLQERNPILAKLSPHYFMVLAKSYRYDEQGRLRSLHAFDNPDSPVARRRNPSYPQDQPPPEQLLYCAFYDDQGRVVKEVTSVENNVIDCDRVERGDGLMKEYRYNAQGLMVSVIGTSHQNRNLGQDRLDEYARARGKWHGNADTMFPEARDRFGHMLGATSEIDQKNGLTSLRTDWFGLLSEDATPLFAERATDSNSLELSYGFPQGGIPLSVLDNDLRDLSRYPRVRSYPLRSGGTVYEMFHANSHVPYQRLWMAGGDIARQEEFDEAGNVVRVINRGNPINSQRLSPQYRENLRAYADTGVLKVTPSSHPFAGFRMYEADARGELQLKIVCWQIIWDTGEPYEHFPWWEKPATPRPQRNEMIYQKEETDYVCGNPDGTGITLKGQGPISKYFPERYGFGMHGISFVHDRSR